jgi:hypothetical protein
MSRSGARVTRTRRSPGFAPGRTVWRSAGRSSR